jgi:hypothetical protein
MKRLLLASVLALAVTPAHAGCPDASRAVDAFDAGIAAVLEERGIVFDRPGRRMGSMRGARQHVGVGCTYKVHTVFGVWNGAEFVNRYYRATMRVDRRGWKAEHVEAY